MSERILFVDDDPKILIGYQRNLVRDFVIETAASGEEALRMLRTLGPYALIISDMNMPGMNGIQFLTKAKEISPDTIRMMLTGNADMSTAIDAVHEGSIFRFLMKPCSVDKLATAINAGITQYRLVNSERELLENTLSGSVRVLIEILAMLDPKLFGRAQALKQHARALADIMHLPNVWKLELAALLAQIGLVTLPRTVLHKLQSHLSISETERDLVNRVPEVSGNLLCKIPRLEEVAEIIRYQNKNFDGTGLPDDNIAGEAIPLGARLLKILMCLIEQESQGFSKQAALSAMRRQQDRFDQKLVEVAFTYFVPADSTVSSNAKPSLKAA
jgi:response regulator RpfG family c-di-GMP phosphodiesterase